ncbi:hypothetical protein [Spirillospora sp. NPDC048824]|uniref:hypothetical protein n=1 Tax=Spirillospora sp. NPDC048824 TaxID=3364526 RepID=UPI00371EFF3C
MSVTTAPSAPAAGETVTVETTVKAVGGEVAGVKIKSIAASPEGVTLDGECEKPFTMEKCTAGDLSSESNRVFSWNLTAPEKTKEVGITVTVSATELTDIVKTTTVNFIIPTPTPTPTPTKTTTPPTSPSATPSKTTSKPSPTKSSSGGGGGDGSSGGSSSSSGSGSGSGDGGPSASISGVEPPNPNSSFDPEKPEVALPPIQAPSPSVAPGPGAVTPQSRLQGNKAPVAQDLTFERMASTQIAWLAALLVAISLLLTQLRLGRRRLPAGAAKRLKGTHRRPRRGMFGK